MRLSYLFLFFSLLILTSCNKDSFLSEEILSESLKHNQEHTIGASNNSLLNENTVLRLPNGLGLQKINDNQTNEDLERGVGVSIPLFSEETVIVKTGTWVTLRFGFFDFYEGGCPEDITTTIFEDINQYIDDNEIAIYFNGEPIDVKSHFKKEALQISDTEFEGFCIYRIPWRYYLNPQAKGDYEFKYVNLDPGLPTYPQTKFARTISWVSGNPK